MFIDIVGYTTLGQRNEQFSLSLIDKQRKLVRPILDKHNGREFKTMGDALLAEFQSTLEAANCSYDIQAAARAYNSSLPFEEQLHLRIGVHVGDVVYDTNGDVLGDTVNIASRVQSLAKADGICITQQVYDQVKNKVDFQIEYLGRRELKNVDFPFGIYSVVLPAEKARQGALGTEGALPQAGEASGSRKQAGGVPTGIPPLDEIIGGGYPQKSSILVIGPSGIGKEALGYWFTNAGVAHNEYCVYVTRHAVREVLEDMQGFGVSAQRDLLLWLASDGGEMKYDVHDLASLLFATREILKKNQNKKVRIVTDVVSSLLMLNQPETVYKFLAQLLDEVKQYDAVILATIEEGMHKPEILTATEHLFDGVIELRFYEEGLSVLSLMRIRKMRGVPPRPGYFGFRAGEREVLVSPYVR
jgi:class 3 adenylate cyclase/KaiC/GvpD/RAD55 family RecA-like ATPase